MGATMMIQKLVLFYAAVLLVTGTTHAHAAEGPGRALVASNVLKLSADTQRSAQAFGILKEFIVPYAGKIRVRWQIKSGDSGKQASLVVTSRIENCTDNTTLTTYKAGQCDIRVAAGDLVQFVLSGTPDINPPFITSTAFVRNARVYYNVVDATGLGAVKTD